MASRTRFLEMIGRKLSLRFSIPSNLQRRAFLVAAAAFIGATVVSVAPDAQARDRNDQRYWTGTWTASPQAPEPPAILPTPAQFDNQTIRQIVHTSIGGNVVRVRLSNEYGDSPLVIGEVHVALQDSEANIVPRSDRALTFSGHSTITIPAGAPALSDPIAFEVPALGNLAISVHLPNATPVQTFHSLGLQTTYISGAGNFTGDINFPTASTTTSWFFLSGVTVATSKEKAAIVAIGDSITDGFASTVDANRRWPNLLAERLQARRGPNHLAVLDQGISGNRTLHHCCPR